MIVTFLGTGTSTGIPIIGCTCPVCQSTDLRNQRCRSSVLIQKKSQQILIDAGPDFRYQALRAHLQHLDAVFITHAHADHILGLDDLRPLSWEQGIDVWAAEATLERLRSSFPYLFASGPSKSSRPRLRFHVAQPGHEIRVGEVSVWPLSVQHGDELILGYRIGDWAYLTDCNGIPPQTFRALEHLQVLVLGALRQEPHPTHFTIDQARVQAQRIGAQQTYFTHLSHELEHQTLSHQLPGTMAVAYDGLRLELL